MAKARAAKPEQAPGNPYAGIKRVTYLSTNVGRCCEHCDFQVGFGMGSADLADSINHYIEQHGYRLLHVGTETSPDGEGRPWHSTVAVLGVVDVPPLRPAPGPIEIIDRNAEHDL